MKALRILAGFVLLVGLLEACSSGGSSSNSAPVNAPAPASAAPSQGGDGGEGTSPSGGWTEEGCAGRAADNPKFAVELTTTCSNIAEVLAGSPGQGLCAGLDFMASFEMDSSTPENALKISFLRSEGSMAFDTAGC